MKTIVIGSVVSSEVVLQKMIESNYPVDYVFSLDEQYAKDVSGYRPIHKLARQNQIPYKTFRKIEDSKNVEIIRQLKPDYIFVVGLSQLVKSDILEAASKGVIGFHPTPLPKFRGRAAMVWQVLLGVHESKCTMFLLDEGMDSGDILIQEPYIIEDTDYAKDIERKMCDAIGRMTEKLLPQLLEGTIQPVKQKEEEATYLLKRTPEDGRIDWGQPSEKIQRLIRAVSRPYPGAFSDYDGKHKVIFWKADYLENKKYYGISGQIAAVTEKYLDIVCEDGLLRVYDYENIDEVRLLAGHKFK
ncbi:MAG: methionyl-tRNA formyltransferase [Lachnospiraceae bacterium]|nr:methionyl-tRNA formyltransferase [Lachnospiraceae bacterium]